MQKSTSLRKRTGVERTSVEEARRSLYEFRIDSRKRNLQLRGYDVEKVLEQERDVLSGIRDHTMSMMDLLEEDSKAHAETLVKLDSQAVDWRCGSTRPQREMKPEVEAGHVVGGKELWRHLTSLDNCENGRVLPRVVEPSNPDNTSHGAYIAACAAEAYADIHGSGDDGITHTCSIVMKHDFTFISPDATRYRFTPDFFANGRVGLSGTSTAFGNSARITMWLEQSDVPISEKRDVYFRSDRDATVESFLTSFYFHEPPSAVVSMGKLAETTITVACQLEVTAKGLSTATLDLTGNGKYWAPRLNVDYSRGTIPVRDRSEGEDAVPFDPEVREGVIPFPFDFYGGASHRGRV